MIMLKGVTALLEPQWNLLVSSRKSWCMLLKRVLFNLIYVIGNYNWFQSINLLPISSANYQATAVWLGVAVDKMRFWFESLTGPCRFLGENCGRHHESHIRFYRIREVTSNHMRDCHDFWGWDQIQDLQLGNRTTVEELRLFPLKVV